MKVIFLVDMAGFPTFWAASTGRYSIKTHPLYIKYSNGTLGLINPVELKQDLGGIILTEDTAAIVQWMSCVLNAVNLINAP